MTPTGGGDDTPNLQCAFDLGATMGPWVITEYKTDELMIFRRNPYYWKGKPDVDEIRIEYIPDDNTRILKLQGGEVDVIDFVPLSQVAPPTLAADQLSESACAREVRCTGIGMVQARIR